jgi:thiosulfate/3-mercaptopyruvate sulfurtransferase
VSGRALITVDELVALLTAAASPAATPAADHDRPLLLDVRWALAGSDRTGYEAGHLPGAVFCDLDAELAAAPGDGGRHPLPSSDVVEGSMRRLGISPGRAVVAYDGGAGAAAARAWWVLRWTGHPDVRVLDGGLAAWEAAGHPLETGDVSPESTADVVVRPGSLPTVEADDVLSGRTGPLLDARAPERFRGDAEPVDPVAGRIPGALSCPTSDLQSDDGRYLPPATLRELLGRRGVEGADPGPRATAYCGSGVTAAQLVLAGHEAGLEIALYPGSWSHWIRDPRRPVARG